MKADVHPGTTENLLVSDGFTPIPDIELVLVERSATDPKQTFEFVDVNAGFTGVHGMISCHSCPYITC